jgi:hypothetical protein
MTQRTLDLNVNPSDETIRLWPLAVRFLLTGEDSLGGIAAFDGESLGKSSSFGPPPSPAFRRRLRKLWQTCPALEAALAGPSRCL